MSFHYYCPVNDLGGGSNWDDYNPDAQIFCDDFFGPMAFGAADLRAKEVGGGKLLTEVRIS